VAISRVEMESKSREGIAALGAGAFARNDTAPFRVISKELLSSD
jgi:hypothetical protein